MSAPLTSAELRAINDKWRYLWQDTRNNYKFTSYTSGEVNGLKKVVFHGIPPTFIARYIWCGSGERISLTYLDKFNNYYLYNTDEYHITDAAWLTIDAWRIILAPEPEPEPEPEPAPDPIDEGGGIIDGVIGNIKEWIRQAILAGLAFLDGPLNIIKGLIASLGQTISGIVSAVSSAIDTVMAKVVGMFDTVIQKIKGVIDEVWGNIQRIWETLKDMFNTVKDAIVQAFQTSWVFIKETFTELWSKMKDGLTYIGDQIVAGLEYLWDKIKDALNWTWKILKGAYTAIVDTVTAVWDRFKDRLTETIDSIKTAFGDFVDRLIEWWESYMAWRDKNRENLDNWTEEKMVEVIKFMINAQRKVLEELG